MSIKIYSDRIEIGDYTLFEGNGGLQFDGVARAENFKSGAGTFQGSVAGYTAGGNPPTRNTIDKFSFVTDGNATDVGDLNNSTYHTSGQSSSTYGYTSAGRDPPGANLNTIDKFPFSVDTNATDVGDLTQARQAPAGQSSTTHGYASGGFTSSPPTVNVNTIDKFLFSIDSNATDVGDLSQTRSFPAGQSSTTHGYNSGGNLTNPPVTYSNTIDKFPFSSDTNATDVGDLTQARESPAGQSSTTHGYSSGGVAAPAPNQVNTIDKFPFSSDTNATDVGDLAFTTQLASGTSSISHGYTAGGYPNGNNARIHKFPFATNANATDVGNLTQGRYRTSGTQV